jgi:hypothetical protein
LNFEGQKQQQEEQATGLRRYNPFVRNISLDFKNLRLRKVAGLAVAVYDGSPNKVIPNSFGFWILISGLSLSDRDDFLEPLSVAIWK